MNDLTERELFTILDALNDYKKWFEESEEQYKQIEDARTWVNKELMQNHLPF